MAASVVLTGVKYSRRSWRVFLSNRKAIPGFVIALLTISCLFFTAAPAYAQGAESAPQADQIHQPSFSLDDEPPESREGETSGDETTATDDSSGPDSESPPADGSDDTGQDDSGDNEEPPPEEDSTETDTEVPTSSESEETSEGNDTSTNTGSTCPDEETPNEGTEGESASPSDECSAGGDTSPEGDNPPDSEEPPEEGSDDALQDEPSGEDDISSETDSTSEEEESSSKEAADPVLPDPYFTIDNETDTYLFVPVPVADAGTICNNDPNCTEFLYGSGSDYDTLELAAGAALQASIDASTGFELDDDTIYIESGTYESDITIDGMDHLTLQGRADDPNTPTTLNGLLTIINSTFISLIDITFLEPISISDSSDIEIMGTADDDTFEVTLAGTEPSTVTVDGKDGSDSYSVNLSGGAGSIMVNIMDSGNSADSDSLVIYGTDLADLLLISTGSVSLGMETVVFDDSIEKSSLDGQDGSDTLTGPDADTKWKITGDDAGEVAEIHFSSIENLTGGTGDDTFCFSDNAGVSGAIDGGGGENSLDYSDYSSKVIVNLNSEIVTAGDAARDPNTATGVGEGITNILNVKGGKGDDILIGTGYGGTFEGGGGSDIIIDDGPQLIIGALKTFLQNFQQELFSDVFGNAIPLIGDVLSKECTAENDLCPGAFITEYILAMLENFNNSSVDSWDTFLSELNTAFGNPGLVAPFAITSLNLITGTLYKEDDFYEVPFGTGLDGLQLAIGTPGEAPPNVIGLYLDWMFDLAFGMDDTLGFFVSSTGTQLTVDLDASFLDQDPHLGTVGLFQAKIVDGVDNDQDGVVDEYSHFTGTYTVTLAGTENISGADLFDLPIQGTLTSDVSQIYLTIELAAFALEGEGDQIGLPEDIPNLFNMALKADVSITWDFVNADTSVAHDEFGGVPSVRFDNIYLDPGPFFNQILRPFIEAIQKITKPLQPIVDILLSEIPLLGDSGFGLLPGDVLGLLLMLAPAGVDKQKIRASVEFIDMVNGITFGDGNCAGGADECVWIPIGDGFEVTDPRVNDAGIPEPEPLFGGWQPTWEMESEKYGFTMGGDLFGEDEFDFFDFPILEDPNEVYGMLLGIHGRFFTINLPEMSLGISLEDLDYELKACLWRTLCIEFYGSITLTAGPMEFGYDTKGIADFVASNGSNPLLLADGFYIADLCEVDGNLETCHYPYEEGVEVERVPLVRLHFDVGVKVSIGVDLYVFAVEAGVAGGIEGEIRFNLHDGKIGYCAFEGLPEDCIDPNIDGRIRGSEIYYNAIVDWTCIFDIEGEIEAYLKVYVEVTTDLGLFTITWYENSWDIVRVTLVEFCQTCENIVLPELAHLDENGRLILHTGDYATYGNTTLKVRDLPGYSEDELFDVSHAGGTPGAETVTVSAYGYSKTYEGVNSIWADGGEGKDRINVKSGVLSDTTLIGGNDNDTLYYKGSGTAYIYGEEGNDTLRGGSGENYLYGGKLYDSEGDGDPNDTLCDASNGANGYVERCFNDELFGGSGINWLYGGNGDDKLFGGSGVNYMYGEDGDDVFSAGEGQNYMYGGLRDDNFIWTTGSGVTEVFGGQGEGEENTLSLNLKSNTTQVAVGAEGSTGKVWVNNEPELAVSFEEIYGLTINPNVGTQIVINDVFATGLRVINVNTQSGANVASSLDSITIFGRTVSDNILVDTQVLGPEQLVHVGFCADAQEFCPDETEHLLELFITGSSVSEGDALIVNGGDGDDFFQVRPGPEKKVSELINLELQGGADSDTVLGLDTPNTWTMIGTNSGNLNAEFTFLGMERLIGGTGFDILIGPNFASTFRMVSDFDGILNDGLYYFSMEMLVGGSSSDTLIGSDTYNFWSLLALNDGELFRFAGPEGLIALLDELQAAGLFTNKGIGNSLRIRLELAQEAISRGRLELAAMHMWMFVWKLDDAAMRGQVMLPGGSTLTACKQSEACRVGGTLEYYSFENLTGGSSDDMFAFEDGMGVTGWIDGAAGTDWLDYSKYSTTVHINAKQGYATGTGGIANIEFVIGRRPAPDNLGNQKTAMLR